MDTCECQCLNNASFYVGDSCACKYPKHSLTLSFMNIHARLHPQCIIINKLSCWYIKQFHVGT